MNLTLAFSGLLSFYAEWRSLGWWLGFTALRHNGLYISVALWIFALTLTLHFLCGFGWYTAYITHMGGGSSTTNARGGRGFDMGRCHSGERSAFYAETDGGPYIVFLSSFRGFRILTSGVNWNWTYTGWMVEKWRESLGCMISGLLVIFGAFPIPSGTYSSQNCTLFKKLIPI